MSTTPEKHVSWASRWTFIMAATGSAVGLGNIWKFPYITGENGGGAFVLLYLLCIAIIGIPVLIAEVLLGRNGRSNPVDSMLRTSRQSGISKQWALVGVMGALTGLLIMSFYSVVGGWILDYIVEAAKGTFTNNDSATVQKYFSESLGINPHIQLLWHSVFTLLTVAVIAAGVINGIGKAVNIMMPVLAGLLLILLAYSYQMGEFSKAFHFLFDADFSQLSGQSVLIAMGHSLFTLSVGMGALMAYGSYMPDNTSIARTAIIIAGFDTVVALVAGLVIFSLVFANNIAPSSGPELMFISLPLAFGQMPGGIIFATLFFILVAIAAWSSAISLLEPAVAWIEEHTPISRITATLAIGLLTWSGGVACIYVDTVFARLDFITSNILLPLGSLLIAVFAGWKIKRKIAKTQLQELSFNQFNFWYAVLRVFTPLGIVAIFIHGLWSNIN